MKKRKFLPIYIKDIKTQYIREKLLIQKECIDENLFLKSEDKNAFQKKFGIAYKQFIMSDNEGFHLRYYVSDLLTNLIMVFDEIRTYCPFIDKDVLQNIIDETLNYIAKILPVVLKNKVEKEVKQLWLEMEFFQNLTVRFHNETTRKLFHMIFMNLKKIYFGADKANEQQSIFNEEENRKKERFIRVNKFKNERNFDVLIYY